MPEGLNFSTDELHDRLIGGLVRLRRRLRWRDSLEALVCRWWPVALAALLVQVIARVRPVEGASLYTLLLLGGGLLVWFFWSAVRPLPLHRVALRADMEGHLRERLTTALELLTQRPAPLTDLHRRQLHDAVRMAEQAARHPQRVFPFRRFNRHLALWGALLALTAALLLLPNPQERVLAERRAVRELAQQEAERIEQARDELARQAGLPDEKRARLFQELADLATQLRQNPGDLEQALADIEGARAALQARLDPQAGSKKAALDRLTKRLSRLSESSGERASPDATTALTELAARAGRLSPQERSRIAASLREEAARAAAVDPELARALTELASALEAGDRAAATDAAQAAADFLRASQEELAFQQDLARALDTLEQARTRLTQGGRGTTGVQASGTSPGNRTSARGDARNPGQGAGQGAGRPGAGGGTQADRLPPSLSPNRGSGSVADPNRSGPGALQGAYEPRVFAPLAGPRSESVDVISGRPDDRGAVRVREGADPTAGLPGGSLIPLRDVLPAYRSAEAEALERTYIPTGLKSYVRDYFAALGE